MRLKVKVFLVPVLEPVGKMTVLIVRGRVLGVGEVAKYEAWMLWTPISETLKLLVLNCRLRLAP